MFLRFFTFLYWLEMIGRLGACLVCMILSCTSYILSAISWLLFFGTLPGLPGLEFKAYIFACGLLFLLAFSSFRLGHLSNQVLCLFIDRPDWGGSFMLDLLIDRT